MSKDAARPWVMGIASSHNGAVCLLHGDEIVVAIQEERLLRLKRAWHQGARRSLAIQYCLDFAGLAPADLSMVVLTASRFNEHPSEDLTLNPALQPVYNSVRTMVVGHHMAHAIGALATSGFTDAAVLVVDGCGSAWCDLSKAERQVVDIRQLARYASPTRGPLREIISLYVAHDTVVEPIEKQMGSEDERPKPGMHRFWSLGFMYEAAGQQIFGNGLDGAGKTMGLAPYGVPVIPARDFYTITDGTFEFLDTVPDRYLHDDRWPLRRVEYQNLAASTQRALEDALFVLLVRLQCLSGARRLCYAGGVALNSVANRFLVEEGGFDDVFIMPASEDSGTAIGAAYFGLWQLTGRNTHRRLAHDAVGRRYDTDEIERAIERCPAVRVAATADVLDSAVDMLCDGKILGWFQGRSELGPRALGQRSIICDPRRPDVKHVLNSTVKFREDFRPFAPVIPLDQLTAWFETPRTIESPFMLRVLPFRPEVRELVPGVVHVDGTGRVQTLTPEANGRFYQLVDRFYQKTGCPVLLNTSFNVAGEPIVETPDDALSCLLLTGLAACVLEEWLVTKDDTWRSPLDLVPRLTVDRVSFEYRSGSDWSANRAATDVRLRFFMSIHLEAQTDLDGLFGGRAQHLLRIVTKTRWGAVMHVTNGEVFEVLRRIDGQRNGWQLLQMLRTDLQISVEERAFTRTLATLRRAGIISWQKRHDDRLHRHASRVVGN
jgi:carbamoyltransferase